MIIKYSHTVGILGVAGKTMTASCHIRNLENKQRSRDDPDDVVSAMTGNRYDRVPYSPQQFPVGIWQVFEPQSRSSKYLAPYFIPTNAKQLVKQWAIDDDGSYREPMDFEVVDHGYGLHYSTSRTTLGCIKIHDIMDLYSLVETIREAIDRKEVVNIEVTE